MNSTADNPSERINLRLKSYSKRLLERAAGVEGKTVSNFILSCALEHAEKTIRNHEIMTLTAKNAETFLNALSGPVTFNEKLNDALEAHSQRVTSK